MNKIICTFLLALLIAAPSLSYAEDTLQNELVYRASLGRADDVKLLLEQGASPNLTSPEGVPALALAAARKDAEGNLVVTTLINAGANVNGTDKQGRTALFYAAREGNKEIVNTLLNNHINYYAIDNHGDIARTLAFHAGHQDVVDMMDNFVKGQTKDVQKQYDDLNTQLKKRYADEQKATQKAVEKQHAIDIENNPVSGKGAAGPVTPDPNSKEAIAALRDTPEFKKGMHDFAFENCAFQYWYYVQSAKQSNELSPEELDIAVNSHKDGIEDQNKHMAETYKLERPYLDRISNNAKQRIFYQLTIMPSNTYRHEQGVGKMDDMKDRCEHIAGSWDESAQPVPIKKEGKGKEAKAGKSSKGSKASKRGKATSGGGQGGGGGRSGGGGGHTTGRAPVDETAPFTTIPTTGGGGTDYSVKNVGGNR